MPSHPCKHPTCDTYLAKPGFCPKHATEAPAEHRDRHRRYDQQQRDTEAKAFYNSTAWQHARETKLAAQPTCDICGRFAEHVHHRRALKERPDLALTQSNLQALCNKCHSRLEAEARGGG